jgi:pimeloyl-ACP methyl ester carboxylesterase
MTHHNEFRRRFCVVWVTAALLAMGGEPLLAQAPTDPGGEPSLPIVFVPGTSGSILKFSDGSVYWLDSNTVLSGRSARGKLSPAGDDTGVEVLQTGGVLDSVRVVLPGFVMSELLRFGLMPPDKPLHTLPIYATFLDWAQTTFGSSAVFLAPNDWRKGAGPVTSEQIDKVVEAARSETKAKKVILLAHSLGGLICRDYIAGVGKGKVDALIAVGTPWLGAPKTARGLEWGYNFGVGFTARPNRFFPNLYWYVKDPSNPGTPIRRDPPFRLTFLANEVTADLARNYPSVFQQLPTPDLQQLYGKSFLFGLTPDAALARLRDKNPALYDAAQIWRKEHLKEDNFGVAHYAIAGLCDPSGDPSEFQDMQMALPGPDHLTAAGNSLRDFANREAIRTRRQIFDQIKSQNIPIFLDEFIAMDTDPAWGDGTSPLLSATAGAQRRADAPLDPSAAAKRLGPGVKVVVLSLEPPYSHGSMLNDSGVRQEVLRAFSERRSAAGLGPDPRADDIGVMTLELATKAGSITLGTIESVTLQVAGERFLTNNQFFQNGELASDSLTSGKTAKYLYHNPTHTDPVSGQIRPLRRSDVQGSVLKLTKAGFTNWTNSGVRLLIDGRPVAENKEEFVFSLSNPSREISIPAR